MTTEGRRETPSTAKRAAVQASVLRATEELLAEGNSYADLGIEKIATRAGISRTAFYFYFADKRELLQRLTEEINALLFEQANVWFSGAGDPRQEIRTALANIAALYREHAVLMRVIVEVATYEERVATFWRSTLGRFVDATERRILEERAAGRTTSANPRATAFALTWMTERTLYQDLVQEGPIPHDELVDALTGIWLRGVYDAGGA
ncbi:MAG: TetR/AcrR family transcriptional regulator [Solirubrobacteraceae bacterium]|jgi:AcrR family transcriptional regulator|nr:TetR/AcrR family transcriptional regulator [Solirubrobacteraceae bacterium]